MLDGAAPEMSGYGAIRGGSAQYGGTFDRSGPYANRLMQQPPVSDSVRQGKLGQCSIHGKSRAWFCLVDDGTGRGTFKCTSENACKISAPGTYTAKDLHICSAHGKSRARPCMEDDGMGGFRCTPENRCKGGGPPGHGTPGGGLLGQDPSEGNPFYGYDQTTDGVGAYAPEDGAQNAVGTVPTNDGRPHQTATATHEATDGGYRASHASDGAVANYHHSAALGQAFGGFAMNPMLADPLSGMMQYGMMTTMGVATPGQTEYMMQVHPQLQFNPPTGTGQEVCSKHKKMRSHACLMEDGMGGLRCSPDYECKVKAEPGHMPPGGTSVCSVHGKSRSRNCMMDDGAGGMQCTSESLCKGSQPSAPQPYPAPSVMGAGFPMGGFPHPQAW